MAPIPTARRPIRLLPRDVAERIAAGEVIDRPAAAAKELVENALDAGATRIVVESRGGGLELLRVSDDGHGIAPDEVELALTRHATSKLAAFEGLEHLITLGFRGEALPSIAAISDLTITTATAESTPGRTVTMRYGELIAGTARARNPGVTVTVRDLFGNVPARRRFLHAARAESQRIGDVVRRYALGRPEVAFTLTFDGHPAFRSEGDGDPRAVAAVVYGAGVAETLTPFAADLPDGSRLSGLLAPGGPWHSNRNHVCLYVNGRWVRSGALALAVEAAYRPFAPAHRHPLLLLHLIAPPAHLDANIHPAKLEVRYHDETALTEVVRETLAAAFGRTPVKAGASLSLQYRLPLARGRSVAEPPQRAYRSGGRHSDDAGDGPAAEPDAASPLTAHGHGQPVTPAPSFDVAGLRYLAGAREGLLVCEGTDGLYLVDQHRAHERVLFEGLLSSGGPGQSQALLTPALLTPGREAAARLWQRAADLEALGFAVEPFGGESVVARAIPAQLAGLGPDAVPDLLAEAMSDAGGWRDRLLSTAACHAAIKKGHTLDPDAARELLRRLASVASPAVCPHGSPIAVQLADGLLSRLFRW